MFSSRLRSSYSLLSHLPSPPPSSSAASLSRVCICDTPRDPPRLIATDMLPDCPTKQSRQASLYPGCAMHISATLYDSCAISREAVEILLRCAMPSVAVVAGAVCLLEMLRFDTVTQICGILSREQGSAAKHLPALELRTHVGAVIILAALAIAYKYMDDEYDGRLSIPAGSGHQDSLTMRSVALAELQILFALDFAIASNITSENIARTTQEFEARTDLLAFFSGTRSRSQYVSDLGLSASGLQTSGGDKVCYSSYGECYNYDDGGSEEDSDDENSDDEDKMNNYALRGSRKQVG
ncbi:uncharacterized protein V1518DRAFT_17138 [Limtongia smithiae]|uniref:uncharacterized protein n=1 Tax=Limtongia smithiae TaxID=1125753 RepID=UPI0034CD57F4